MQTFRENSSIGDQIRENLNLNLKIFELDYKWRDH